MIEEKDQQRLDTLNRNIVQRYRKPNPMSDNGYGFIASDSSAQLMDHLSQFCIIDYVSTIKCRNHSFYDDSVAHRGAPTILTEYNPDQYSAFYNNGKRLFTIICNEVTTLCGHPLVADPVRIPSVAYDEAKAESLKFPDNSFCHEERFLKRL